MKPKALFLNVFSDWTLQTFPQVYGVAQRERLGQLVDLFPDYVKPEDLGRPDIAPFARETEFVFSTWGMPELSAEQIESQLPNLKAVFYAAGTVKGFAKPLLARNITVVSAWAANAIPVSEFTVAQIILGLKGALPATRQLKTKGPVAWRHQGITGAFGATVALISLGQIGRKVAELLKPFDIKVIAHDPHLPPALAHAMNVELVSLEECFTRADVVSLHAPSLPETRHLIKRQHFMSMKPYSTFINTARAVIVDGEAMLDVLASRPDLTAIIDVTDPQEPPPAGSRLYSLPNVYLTPHLAGSVGNEVARMAEYVIDECARMIAGQPLRFQVSVEMLDTMA